MQADQQSIGWPQPSIPVSTGLDPGNSLPVPSGPALSANEWMQNPLINSAFSFSTPLPSEMTVHPQILRDQNFHNMAMNPDPISLVTQLQTASPEGLTPCSLAYSLAYQYNRKGHDTTYLDVRLFVGYRACAVVGDGCAVENKVLFRVLADIS